MKFTVAENNRDRPEDKCSVSRQSGSCTLASGFSAMEFVMAECNSDMGLLTQQTKYTAKRRSESMSLDGWLKNPLSPVRIRTLVQSLMPLFSNKCSECSFVQQSQEQWKHPTDYKQTNKLVVIVVVHQHACFLVYAV